MKALARDPQARYRTARELGRDLSTIMFQFGRSVSSFDIATLVQEVVAARASEKRRQRREDKMSIIGTLIDEAMLEFTSLDQRGSDAQPAPREAGLGSSPLNIGSFEDMQDWTSDLNLEHAVEEARKSLPGDEYMAGNLAALEDDAPGQPLGGGVHHEPRPQAPRAVPTSGTSSAPAPASSPSSGGGAVVGVILLLVAVAGAAGAYFGGLFP
jgi:serine/threonine-protein kinase